MISHPQIEAISAVCFFFGSFGFGAVVAFAFVFVFVIHSNDI